MAFAFAPARARPALPLRLAVVLLLALSGLQGVATNARAEVRPGPNVFVFKGFANIFSVGMDTLAARLRDAGYQVTLRNHGYWPIAAEEVLATYRASPARTRIAIIGHSLGANAALEMARWLAEREVPVSVVVTYDPTRPGLPLPPLVRRVLNFYAPGALGSALLERSGVENVNMVDARLGHTGIDKSELLHDRTLAAIRSAFR